MPIKGIFPPLEMLVQPLLSPLPCQGPRLWELRAGPRSSERLVFGKKNKCFLLYLTFSNYLCVFNPSLCPAELLRKQFKGFVPAKIKS